VNEIDRPRLVDRRRLRAYHAQMAQALAPSPSTQ
jgi:hypothetical protein